MSVQFALKYWQAGRIFPVTGAIVIECLERWPANISRIVMMVMNVFSITILMLKVRLSVHKARSARTSHVVLVSRTIRLENRCCVDFKRDATDLDASIHTLLLGILF